MMKFLFCLFLLLLFANFAFGQKTSQPHGMGKLLMEKGKYNIYENALKSSACDGDSMYLVAVFDIAPTENAVLNLDTFLREIAPVVTPSCGYNVATYNLNVYLKNSWFGSDSSQYPVEYDSFAELKNGEMPFFTLSASLNYKGKYWRIGQYGSHPYFYLTEKYWQLRGGWGYLNLSEFYIDNDPEHNQLLNDKSRRSQSNWNLIDARKAIAKRKYDDDPAVQKALKEEREKAWALAEPARQAAKKAKEDRLAELGFPTDKFRLTTGETGILLGDFGNTIFNRDSGTFLAMFSAYIESYGELCKNYLPSNKVEIITQECDAERVTRNGYGVETGRYCTKWVDKGTGIFADPAYIKIKADLRRKVESDVGDTFNFARSVNGARKNMDELIKENPCDSRGAKTWHENIRRFALGLAPLAPNAFMPSKSSPKNAKPVPKTSNKRGRPKK